jgi:hypothetical protein
VEVRNAYSSFLSEVGLTTQLQKSKCKLNGHIALAFQEIERQCVDSIHVVQDGMKYGVIVIEVVSL